MELNILDENKNVELNLKNTKQQELAEKQDSFLNTVIGKAVNKAIDFGIKTLLPDFLEDTVIDIKDTLLENGLQDGIEKVVNKGIDIGKSTIGTFTGKFDNISQVELAVKKGGIISKTSDVLDEILEKTKEKDLLDYDTRKYISESKEEILLELNTQLKDILKEQKSLLNKVNKNLENWNTFYKQQDFENMDKEYIKMKKNTDNILPLESILQQVEEVENIHNLIKNNGKNFNLSEQELELAKKIV